MENGMENEKENGMENGMDVNGPQLTGPTPCALARLPNCPPPICLAHVSIYHYPFDATHSPPLFLYSCQFALPAPIYHRSFLYHPSPHAFSASPISRVCATFPMRPLPIRPLLICHLSFAPAIYAGSLLIEQSIRGRNSPSALMPACPCAFSITRLSAPTAQLPLLGKLEVANRGAVGQGE